MADFARYRVPLVYLFVGLCGVTIDLLLFSLLRLTPIHLVVANLVSIAAAAFMTFALHSRFTFGVKISGMTIVSYAGVVVLGLLLATALFSILIELEFSVLHAKVVATSSAIGLQFLLNRFVVFRLPTGKEIAGRFGAKRTPGIAE